MDKRIIDPAQVRMAEAFIKMFKLDKFEPSKDEEMKCCRCSKKFKEYSAGTIESLGYKYLTDDSEQYNRVVSRKVLCESCTKELELWLSGGKNDTIHKTV